MADDDLSVGVDIYAKETGIKETATAVSSLAEAFEGMEKSARQVMRGLTGMEKSLADIRKGANEVDKATQQTIKSQGELASVFARAQRDKIHPGLAASEFAREVAARLQGEKSVSTELQRQNSLRRDALKLAREARNSGGYGPKLETPTGPGSAAAVAGRFQKSGMFEAEDATVLQGIKDANLAGAKAAMEHANRLTNLRYSLYDVRNTALMTATGLAVMNIGTLKAAADYETAMAQISRTSGATGPALENIRSDFQDLAATIPVAFSELAKIGTLGGQLNIPADRLAAFTEVTAKFSATTNVASESAATAFGRLDALLDDVNGNYEALGSSILQVGINSVATETEIINTTNQITAAAQQAGFAAKEIIGLAASFASLGVAPEAARGTTIRVFSTINTAVSETNENLAVLARYAGTSAEEFASAWEGDPAEAFQSVLNGMQAASEGGQNLEEVIRSMGITAVRDINALLKLAQNADIVGNNFAYAAQGFDDATALGDAFAVQAETLASKLQMLAGSFQALLANLGESGLGPVGWFVDQLNEMLKVATDLADNPFVQWLTLVVGGTTAVLAVGSLLIAALARMGSAGIAAGQALLTLKYEMLGVTGGATGARAAVDAMSTSLATGGATARALTVALRGLAVTTGIGIAIGGIALAVDAISQSMKSAEERATDYYGDLSSLTKALTDDTKAVKEGAESYGTVEGTLTRVTSTTADWAVQLQDATGHQATLDSAINTTTESLGKQEFQIGANARAWAAEKLASDEAIQKLLQLSDKSATAGGPQLDVDGYLTSLMRNDTESARAILEQFKADVDRFRASEYGAFGATQNATAIINDAQTAADRLNDAYTGAASTLDVYNRVMELTGGTTQDAANAAYYNSDAIDELGGGAITAADRLSELNSSLANAFSVENAFGQMAQDMYTLAEGVFTAGNSFDVLGATGQANLGNLQSTIASTIMAGSAMGADANKSIAAVFLQLQAMGIETANLLSRVAGIGGSTLAGIQSAMGAATGTVNPATAQLVQYLSGVTNNARAATKAIGGGRGSKSMGGAAQKAKEEIRTLLDYSKDLAGVWGRAFDIRFNVGTGLDEITSGWRAVSEATAEAQANIREIQAQLSQVGADKTAYEYFLSIAELYGDQLRAAEIRAKLAQLDVDQAEASSKLAKEQDKTNKTLEGNSDAAIENRKVVLGMVSSYQSLIEQYAASGMDQAALAAKAAQLKQEFINQATQLGYNSAELGTYAIAFDDVSRAISRVPRNVNVTANVDPALQALNEFEANVRQKVAAARQAASGGINIPVNTSGGGIGDLQYVARAVNLSTQIASLKSEFDSLGTYKNSSRGTYLASQIDSLTKRLNSNSFASGGYTGNVGDRQVAGVVHGKEFVVNAENTAKFRPILEAMNKGRMPITPVGVSDNIRMVELSARDRQLLAAAGNVTLTIDGQVVGRVTNAANFGSSRRGSN